MKFVVKDRGESAENSSGGGVEGLLMELIYMLLAYGLMIGAVVVGGMVIIAVAAYLWGFAP